MDDFIFTKKHVDDYFNEHLCPNCKQCKLEPKYNTVVDNGKHKYSYLECSGCGLMFYKEYKFTGFVFDGWMKRKERLNDNSKERIGDTGTGSKGRVTRNRVSDGGSIREADGKSYSKLGSKGKVRRQRRKVTGTSKGNKKRGKKTNSKV